MCEVRVIYEENSEEFRVDLAGYQNVVVTAQGGIETTDKANRIADIYNKLTNWDVVTYTEKEEVKKVLIKQ